MRPFGISLIFAGVDKKGSRIFWTDPSGAYLAYKAWAIGSGGDASNEILEAEYRDDIVLDEAIILALKCMAKILEGKITPQKVRMAIIPVKTRKFKKLTNEDIAKYLGKINSAKKAASK